MNIKINVPDGVSGEYRVETFIVSKKDESRQRVRMFSNMGRYVPAGTYKRLMRNDCVVMSNTPDEIDDFMYFVNQAEGIILINSLGLGVMLKALLNKKEVKEVIVIEKSEDVIKLIAPTYEKDKRVKIIKADAFEYIPPKGKKFDFIWHDIWDYICSDNLIEMTKLHRKYGRKTTYQNSWCKNECLRYR
jgi:spermidine synthase